MKMIKRTIALLGFYFAGLIVGVLLIIYQTGIVLNFIIGFAIGSAAIFIAILMGD